MLKLSRWARLNPWKARLIVVLSHILLVLISIETGSRLQEAGIKVPAIIIYTALGVYILSVMFYPVFKGDSHLFYKQRKPMDFLLVFSACVMIAGTVSNPGLSQINLSSSNAAEIKIQPGKHDPRATEILASLEHRDKHSLTRSEKKILRKEFKFQLKEYIGGKLSGNQQRAENAGLILLAIVGALGLFYLVLSLSCSLSCNGNDGAALAVALLGGAAIAVGLIFIIRGIRRKNIREKTSHLKPD